MINYFSSEGVWVTANPQSPKTDRWSVVYKLAGQAVGRFEAQADEKALKRLIEAHFGPCEEVAE